MNKDEKKFISMLLNIVITLILLSLVALYFILNKNIEVLRLGFWLLLVILISLAMLISWACILVLKILNNKAISNTNFKIVKFFLGLIYPLLVGVSSIINTDKDGIRRVYASINNFLIKTKNIKVRKEDILVLLPHCLQDSKCQYKITNDIYNCRMCGKCNIMDIINICNKYSVKVIVATGGTLAREWIKRLNPKCIIAVACERDLASGINDVKLLPVVGVINERPNGPCHNTRVNINKLEEAIKLFLKED